MRIIISLAVIFMAQNIWASRDHESDCLYEHNTILYQSETCYGSLPKSDELITEMTTTLSRSGGHPGHIKWFTTKFCSIGDRALSCVALGTDYTEPCRSLYQIKVATKEVTLNASKAILNYICKDDGQLFFDLQQDNGIEVFTQLDSCSSAIGSNQMHDPNYPIFRINPAYCESVQEMFVCFANLVNNHPNPNLRRVGREVYDILSHEFRC